MKELSIEQKAQRYDEAIKKLKILHDDWATTQNRAAKEVEEVFPELNELKESEDEKIRKEIINYFEHHPNIIVKRERKSDWISWLEKQGEQKPVQEIEPAPIFKIGDILKRKGRDYTFRVDRIQGGYYHCDRNHGAFFPIEEQDNWELVEQNLPWSEEDEAVLDALIRRIEGEDIYVSPHLAVECLKSLKDRVQPQPKQEWSEEDKRALNDAIVALSTYAFGEIPNILPSQLIEDAERLKSLRPQSQWKPSDEEMDALNDVISSRDIKYDVLSELWKDLKRLRKE